MVGIPVGQVHFAHDPPVIAEDQHAVKAHIVVRGEFCRVEECRRILGFKVFLGRVIESFRILSGDGIIVFTKIKS